MPHAALAVDIGGTKVEAALIDADGVVLEGSRHRRPTGRDATREELIAAIRDAATAAVKSGSGVAESSSSALSTALAGTPGRAAAMAAVTARSRMAWISSKPCGLLPK